MAIRRQLDSDVDQITQKAIQGVNAFIASYLDVEEPTLPARRLAVGPAVGAALRKAKPAPKKPAPRRRTR